MVWYLYLFLHDTTIKAKMNRSDHLWWSVALTLSKSMSLSAYAQFCYILISIQEKRVIEKSILNTLNTTSFTHMGKIWIVCGLSPNDPFPSKVDQNKRRLPFYTKISVSLLSGPASPLLGLLLESKSPDYKNNIKLYYYNFSTTRIVRVGCLQVES